MPPIQKLTDSSLEGEYRSLEQRLASCGIHPSPDLAAHRQQLGAHFILGQVLLEGDFGGFRGVTPQHTLVTGTDDITPLLPVCVKRAKGSLAEPDPTNLKYS